MADRAWRHSTCPYQLATTDSTDSTACLERYTAVSHADSHTWLIPVPLLVSSSLPSSIYQGSLYSFISGTELHCPPSLFLFISLSHVHIPSLQSHRLPFPFLALFYSFVFRFLSLLFFLGNLFFFFFFFVTKDLPGLSESGWKRMDLPSYISNSSNICTLLLNSSFYILFPLYFRLWTSNILISSNLADKGSCFQMIAFTKTVYSFHKWRTEFSSLSPDMNFENIFLHWENTFGSEDHKMCYGN